MRSCAFFIFDAATISMALVILRVLCTLLILFRISFDPAIVFPLERTVLLEVLDRRSEGLFPFGIKILRLLDLVDECRVLTLDELTQPRFKGERLLDRHVVIVALVDREQRQRLFGNGQRRILRLLHELGDELAALELLAG